MSHSNPLLRVAEEPAEVESPYLRFGLTQNPFPDSPTIVPESDDPRLNGEIYHATLRGQEQAEFERLLISRPKAPASRPIALLMDFATRRGRGIGKTAFLIHQRRRIMKDLGEELTQGSKVLLASHIAPEGSGRTRKFWQFSKQLAYALNQDCCIAWALWRIRALCGVIPAATLELVNFENPSETLGNNGWLSENNVEVTFSLNATVERELRSAGVSDPMSRALAWHGAEAEMFQQHILDGMSEHKWRQEGPRLVFEDLVRLFVAARINQVVLLVDEVEKIVVPQNSSERRGFVDDIRRHFVDGPFESVYRRMYSLLFTIHPYVQEVWSPHWNATGLDRVCAMSGGLAKEYTIYFQPLRAEETAVPLVLSYMDHFRVGREQRGSLFPFDRDAVVAALSLSGGVPGLMLTLLRLVLDKAVENGWAEVGADRVKAIHKSEIPVEPEDDESRESLPNTQIDLLA